MSAIDSKLALSFPLNKRVQEGLKLIYPQTATKMNISFDQISSEDISKVYQVNNWYEVYERNTF